MTENMIILRLNSLTIVYMKSTVAFKSHLIL